MQYVLMATISRSRNLSIFQKVQRFYNFAEQTGSLDERHAGLDDGVGSAFFNFDAVVFRVDLHSFELIFGGVENRSSIVGVNEGVFILN